MSPPVWPAGSVAIVGSTAIGKSALALALADAFGNAEIVSVDSMQVYRGMDIGTAKPTAEEQALVPHHLIDLVDVSGQHTVADFQVEAALVAADLVRRDRRAILVGGTGLYVRAVVEGLELAGQYPDVRAELEAEPDGQALHRRLVDLDPLAASRIEPENHRRLVRALEVTIGSGRPFSSHGAGMETYGPSPVPVIGLRRPREEINGRIVDRFAAQMEAGFLDEVDRVVNAGWSRNAAQALGYRELAAHLAGATTLEAAIESSIVRIRRFARRQERWFRRDPRIHWVDDADRDARLTHVESILETGQLSA